MTVNCKLFDILYRSISSQSVPGADLGEDCRVAPPRPTTTTKDDLRRFNTIGILQEKKGLCFICVEVNHETMLKNKNGSP